MHKAYKATALATPSKQPDTPPTWRVTLYTHSEDGVQIEFFGEFFEQGDAEAICAAWRDEKQRPVIWLSINLRSPRAQFYK